MSGSGLLDLTRAGKMDVAVALIDAGAAEYPGLLGGAPQRRMADLVDRRWHALSDCSSYAFSTRNDPRFPVIWLPEQYTGSTHTSRKLPFSFHCCIRTGKAIPSCDHRSNRAIIPIYR